MEQSCESVTRLHESFEAFLEFLWPRAVRENLKLVRRREPLKDTKNIPTNTDTLTHRPVPPHDAAIFDVATTNSCSLLPGKVVDTARSGEHISRRIEHHDDESSDCSIDEALPDHECRHLRPLDSDAFVAEYTRIRLSHTTQTRYITKTSI